VTTYTDQPRVGLLVVPWEVVATEELPRLLPTDVLTYQQRVAFEEIDTPANRQAVATALRDGLRLLHHTRPRAVAFACTSGGSFAGAAWHEELLATMRAVDPNIEFVTAADAVARTLVEFGLRRIAMGTPYNTQVLAGLIEILDGRGIEILSAAPLFPDGQPDDPWDLMTTTPERMYQFALEADRADADCVFLSCSGLHSTPVITRIEEKIGKPLLTSNIAIANILSQVLDGVPRVTGRGRILAHEATYVG
jgi:maleate isomerase